MRSSQSALADFLVPADIRLDGLRPWDIQVHDDRFYSCAYFDGTDDLAQAQQEKLELTCRKLHLEKGMRVLDIGCGWGGLARHAARHHGCSVVGITLSAEQQEYATEFCRGLPVEIRLHDYRNVGEPFDRVVSVGMMEHVGHKNYRRYLEAAFRCLPPGGLFLCHTITGGRSRVDSDPRLTRYIFPHSMLPSPALPVRDVGARPPQVEWRVAYHASSNHPVPRPVTPEGGHFQAG